MGLAGDVGLVEVFIDFTFVLLEEGEDDLIVDDGGTSGLGVEEVDVEGELEEVVEGDEGEGEANEGVHDGEEGVDDPVSQPLLVILAVISSFQGLETHVGGVEETDDVADQTGTDVQEG